MDGTARVFDAHCQHLGAHLGHGGRVVATASGVRSTAGAGTARAVSREIPGSAKRLPALTMKSWPVAECNGFVHVWFHARGARPATTSSASATAKPSGRRGARTPTASASTCRILTENILDRQHFPNVHDMAPPTRITSP
jgi:phenylpropionate dioxygenase-like ring-hydroxylating dioxygenase large terminal subunit